ncbi:uncharacterized protein AKAME5_001501000 [Lates japonicus]|uniref:Immunoglobulin subtype domain-containing protein n=1 Tax=Lates japonicus TaxID=270547 RepID=A0AAD3N143_LATJO|nr:uncharacterized protein AKAME5_001501000 [Lates japonicus]
MTTLFTLVSLTESCYTDSNNKKTVVKTTVGELDVKRVCTTATLHIITLIVCKISTKRSRGEECRLLYQHGQGFEYECDSRFRLRTENQTVFLHLTNLTSVDSGNYTCECSHFHGTDALHLIITVEGDEEASLSPVAKLCYTTVIGSATAFIIVAGVCLGLIHRKNHCRDHTRSGLCGLSVSETPCSLYSKLHTTSSSCLLTSMGGWTLFFVLLLPLTVCSEDSEVTVVKTLWTKPDVTPVCTNNTKQGNDTDIITLIVCLIRTERSRGEECKLLYQHGQDFE